MSVKNFSKVQYVKSVDTGELIRCGGFQVADIGEFGYIRVLIYIHGMLGGTEIMRTRVYLDNLHTKLLYTSDWTVPLSTATPGSWYGWISTEYSGENINPNITYYLEVEFSNYTRNTETFYIGVVRDFPYPIYKITPTPLKFYQHPLAMQIFPWIKR
jgi:hypothetical protein